MKCFVIETRNGLYVALPQTIAGQKFPLSYLSERAATHFPFRAAAESSIKKYQLKNCEIKETEIG